MIEKFNPADFDKIYAILEASFPKDERRPYDEQKALLDETLYSLYIIRDGEEIVAFIASWDFEKMRYIEHFAVNPKYRNNGIGAKMINEFIASGSKPVCLEAEPPEDDMSKRRIGFYKRNGFFLNNYPYIQPPMSKGYNWVPLMIMTTGREINPEEYEELKSTLYRFVYKHI